MSIRVALLFLAFVSITATADEYSVQIGAFRSPDLADIQIPPGTGELLTEPGPSGTTRFLVGPFASRADAERARAELRSAGYPGAFIRRSSTTADAPQRVSVPAVAMSEPQERSSDDASLAPDDLETLMSLSEEEREGLVYLDGRLHRKEGERFVPLRD